MDVNNQSLRFAVLHDTVGVPTEGGKMVNLKATLDPKITGTAIRAMTLKGALVLVELEGGSALIPVSNFKLLVPAN